MRTIGVIVHRAPAYAMDWTQVITSCTPNTILVLIAPLNTWQSLTNFEKQFIKFYDTDVFTFEHLSLMLQKIHTELAQPGDRLRISALFEFDVGTCARLRDTFRDAFNVEGPGEDLIKYYRNKLCMKEALAKKRGSIPKYVAFDQASYQKAPFVYVKALEKALSYPLFAKPIDAAGSIGTTHIGNRDQLYTWARAVEVHQRYELDEFIQGKLYHCDSIVIDSAIAYTFVSEYLHPNADAAHGLPLATMTMSPQNPDYLRLKAFAENTLRSLPGIPDGVTHLEVFIRSKDNELVFLEVAARPPGARVPEMYQYSTRGIDIRSLHTKLSLGLNVERELSHLKNPDREERYAAMWDTVNPKNEVFVRTINPPRLRSFYKITRHYRPGAIVSPWHNNGNTMANVIFWNKNFDTLRADFLSLNGQELFELGPVQNIKPREVPAMNTSFCDARETPECLALVNPPVLDLPASFDAGVWEKTPHYDPMTGVPVFTYSVYKRDRLVGSADFYGQPMLCFSGASQHNLIRRTGVLLDFPVTPEMSLGEVCRILPPTMFDRVLYSAQGAAVHGGLRAGSKVVGVLLSSSGIISDKTSGYLQHILYYGGFFTVRFMTYYSQAQATDVGDSLQALYDSIIKAAGDTGNFLVTTIALNGASRLTASIARVLSDRGLSRLGSRLNAISNILPFSIFAYNSSASVVEIAASVASGTLTETVIDRAAAYAMSRPKNP